MFKKYNGFPTRLKKPGFKDAEVATDEKKQSEKPDKEKPATIFRKHSESKKKEKDSVKKQANILRRLKEFKRSHSVSFKAKKDKKFEKLQWPVKQNKKKFSLPEKSSTAIDISGNINSMIDFFKYKFRIPKAVLFGIIFGLIIAFIVIFVSILTTSFNKVKTLAAFQPNVTTNIYDKNGLLISELFRQKREVVPLSKIPPDLVRAFIAIEDNDFYDHYGINIKGIVRAFFINIFHGRIKQGGSTITQQLAKILLTSRKRNIFRKINEAFIAIMIEMTYTKNEIMALYLNQIFFGHGVYGVESASKFYFNKHVWELNIAKSAILATLPSAPNRLSPIRHPDRSMERHRVVLAKMVDCGFIKIPEAEKSYMEFWPDYLAYINELPPTITSWSRKVDRAPWFTEYIRRKLINKYGEEVVYREGLTVYTTLDLNKQIAAQKIMLDSIEKQSITSNNLSFKNEDYIIETYYDIVEIFSLLYNINPKYGKGSHEFKKLNDYLQKGVIDELEAINFIIGFYNIDELLDLYKEKYLGYKNFQKVEGCLISIDQKTGYIEAMVGGREFSSINQLNRVTQSQRQPGSAIKPLLYASAIESGDFTAASTIIDSPLVYVDKEGVDWIPENYESRYYGRVRMRRALDKSINVISIKIAEELGIDYITDYFAKMLKIDEKNIKKRIPRNFSIALGSFEVKPIELARAYAIIANGGRDVVPFSIRYIKDRNGKVIENPEEEVKKILKKKKKDRSIQIMDTQTAQVMISMLKSVMTSGTGLSASINMPAGGKTGTTNNWRDAWFVGFSPRLTTCVWMGFDKLGLSLGMGQSGGIVAAPVWGKYMKEAHSEAGFSTFPNYASLNTVEICAITGLLPSFSCKRVINEVFIDDTAPETECDSCKNYTTSFKSIKKGPRENILKYQKESILRNINKKKEGTSIFNDIGNDLLD